MNCNKSLVIEAPFEEESGGVSIQQQELEIDEVLDIISMYESLATDPKNRNTADQRLTSTHQAQADTGSSKEGPGHETGQDKYLDQENMLMNLVLKEAIQENGCIATTNPHATLSIAHDLVSFLLRRKAATSTLLRRHAIPSNTTPQLFPRNIFIGQWTPWTSFTLSKSREVQPGTLQCSQLMKPGDIEFITVSDTKFVKLMTLLEGDEMLMKTVWEMPDGPRHVSPLLGLMKPNFGLVEELGERVIAWRVHGLDVSYFMDRLGYRIPGMVWPLEKLSEEL